MRAIEKKLNQESNQFKQNGMQIFSTLEFSEPKKEKKHSKPLIFS